MSEDADALRIRAEEQKAAKRYHEHVKTLLQLAGVVADAGEKVALYTEVAEIYTGRFANQAEAVKAYEAVLAIDPENRGAVEYLRGMYEKRRDWGKLVVLERSDADRLTGAERARKLVDIAKLTTERVKKPEVCIELWEEVLDSDPANAEALAALGALYARTKEFDKLAALKERRATPSPPSPTPQEQRSVTVVCLGNADAAVVRSAVALLDEAQEPFRFVFDGRRVPLPEPDAAGRHSWSSLLALVQKARAGAGAAWIIGVLDQPIEGNWFSRFSVADRVAFFTTHAWSFLSHLPVAAFVAHEIAASFIRMRTNLPFHEDMRGCLQDLCVNKPDISFKLRTGDVCPRCTEALRSRLVSDEIDAILAMLEEVRRVALCRAPASADVSSLADTIDRSYPFPIAYCFRAMQVEISSAEKWRRLIATVEIAVKYCSLVLLSTLRDRPDAWTPELRARVAPLARASLGTWVDAFFGLIDAVASGKLVSLVAGRVATMARARDARAAADRFCARRNLTEHGFVEDEVAYDGHFEDRIADAEAVLSFVAPLCALRLLLPAAGLRRRSGVSSFEAKLLEGSHPVFKIASFETSEEVDTDCLIHDPDTGMFRSLHPLLVVDRCAECLRESVFVFQKYDGRVALYMEYGTTHTRKRPDLVADLITRIPPATE